MPSVVRSAWCVLALLTLAAALCAQGPAPSRYVQRVPLEPGDDPRTILHKAASVVPNLPQRLHHEAGFVGFIHFGPNTFTGVEWGSGLEDAALFDPGETLDTDQWCRVMKAAGMRKVVITVKHHDGFCLWQTRYNDTHSVRASPWRDGRGDVLRELSDSARRHGLQLGVYLSPADLYQIESADGLYGNLSVARPSVVPTDPAAFHDDPLRARADRPAGAPTFTLPLDDYNRYFMNQLYELLTEYGPIHEVWFDGAHPKRKGGQQYVKDEWFAMIRALAPEAAIFGGPDARWCGNESGVTREAEWNVLPVQDLRVVGEDRPRDELGSDRMLAAQTYDVYGTAYEARQLWYLISEVDTSIRAGWFWRDESQDVRTPDDVFDIWERAVGGNAVFLLNVPPDRTGRFGARDVACLLEVGQRIRSTYDEDLTAGASVTCAGAPLDGLLDGDLATYWQADAGAAELLVQLPEPRRLNRFMLREAVADVGQRVKRHALDAWIDGAWRELATGATVGWRKILRFPVVRTERLRLRILEARQQPTVAEVSAHLYRARPPAVEARREPGGRVRLEVAAPSHVFSWKHLEAREAIPHEADAVAIHYTLDGSAPDATSPRYSAPLALPDGGRLRARSVKDGALGPELDRWLGLAPEGLSIHGCSSEHDAEHRAALAVDGDPDTFWHTSWAGGHPAHPHTISLDLGRVVDVAGLTWLPRQDRRTASGMIERGEVLTSLDGERWEPAAECAFGNVVNDPRQRVVRFEARPARFVRLISSAGAQGTPFAAAAELGVLPARLGEPDTEGDAR